MGDIQVTSISNSEIWRKEPDKLEDSELQSVFNKVWKDADTQYREAELVRVNVLLTEINRRSAKKEFYVSICISIIALIIAAVSLIITDSSLREGSVRNQEVVSQINKLTKTAEISSVSLQEIKLLLPHIICPGSKNGKGDKNKAR